MAYDVTIDHIHNMKTDGVIPGNEGHKKIRMYVVSRKEAESYVPTPGIMSVCISLWDKTVSDAPAKISGMFQDVLYLEFDDTEEVGPEMAGWPPEILYNDALADQVAEFVNKYIDTAQVLVIHCFAGINRSRSMSSAIAKHFDLPYKWSVGNALVYDTTLAALQRYKKPE